MYSFASPRELVSPTPHSLYSTPRASSHLELPRSTRDGSGLSLQPACSLLGRLLCHSPLFGNEPDILDIFKYAWLGGRSDLQVRRFATPAA